MRWFKELFKLIGWLFTSRPSDVAYTDMEVVTMKYFPFKGYKYMSWCGRIVVRGEKGVNDTQIGDSVLTHEGGHVIQAVYEHGDNWFRYYWMYFLHWLKHNPLTKPSSACYYCNRYEVEAYAQEHNPGYWVNYSRDNLKGKYSIKHAKKKYRELGCDARKWKEYIKTL